MVNDEGEVELYCHSSARENKEHGIQALFARRFDPARPLALFADHGFRLSPAGDRYEHGGSSSLERIVPLWTFAPRP